MANRDNPHGFSGTRSLYGGVVPIQEFPVDASNATAIYLGDVIDAENDGNVAPAAAGADDSVLGVAAGIKDTNGIPVGHPNSAVSTKYLGGTTAGIIEVQLALPGCLFVCQSDTGASGGTGVNTVAQTDRFQTADHVAGTGSTTTGLSGHELDATDIGTGGQLKIIDKVDDPDNNWDLSHVDLLVVFAESFWYDATAGI